MKQGEKSRTGTFFKVLTRSISPYPRSVGSSLCTRPGAMIAGYVYLPLGAHCSTAKVVVPLRVAELPLTRWTRIEAPLARCRPC